MPIATVADLVAALRTHRLLAPDQLDALATPPGPPFERGGTGGWLPPDARAAARHFVQRGWLTTYQVNEIFLGRGANLLLGSYVLLELLGEGGMGQVFKARNWKLGQVVALKLIRKERLANPNTVKRFYREIRAAAKLEHPNIVRALDADEANGTHFFVMEFVVGQDLHKLVKTSGPLEVSRACEYVRQAALGLQHAQERGLVHRDIKPHNLLVCSEQWAVGSKSGAASPSLPTAHCPLPTVKILDMGLARIDTDADGEHSSTMTQEGTVVGTPDYIAPEQVMDSHGVDIRADLYSLGCTLYFLLAGRPPFAGGTFMEKLLKHQQQMPPSLHQFRVDLPAEVEAIVTKLMAKRPEERYQTPADLVAELETVLSGSMTTLPSAVSITLPADSFAPPANVFAEAIQSSATQALIPELVKRPVLPAADSQRSRMLRLGLVSTGVLIAAVLLIVTVRSIFTGRKPPPAPVPVVIGSGKQRAPTFNELAKAEQKRLDEEERQQKEAESKRLAEEEAIRKQRAAEAEEPFKLLEAKFNPCLTLQTSEQPLFVNIRPTGV